jgi:hypothetical protein
MGTSAGGKKLIDTVGKLQEVPRFAGSGQSRKDIANYMQTQFPDKRIGYAGQPSTPTPDQIPNQELTNLPQEQGVPSLEQRRRRARRQARSAQRSRRQSQGRTHHHGS